MRNPASDQVQFTAMRLQRAFKAEPRARQRGQSLVEFAISSIVLLLLMMGLLDLSRAFYFAVNLQGAAREGARHGSWFDTASRSNTYLDDADIMDAVNSALAGSNLTGTYQSAGGCLSP